MTSSNSDYLPTLSALRRSLIKLMRSFVLLQFGGIYILGAEQNCSTNPMSIEWLLILEAREFNLISPSSFKLSLSDVLVIGGIMTASYTVCSDYIFGEIL